MKANLVNMSACCIFCSFVFGCGSGDKTQVAKPNAAAQANSLKLAKEADDLFDKAMSLRKEKKTSESIKVFILAHEKYFEIVNSGNFLEDKGRMAKVFGRAISLSENQEQKVDIAVKCFRFGVTPLLIPDQTGDKEALSKAKAIIKSEDRTSSNDVPPSGESKPNKVISGNTYRTQNPSNSKNSADQAIQSMKNAGTYTPEAERNIRELYNNQKKFGLVK